MLNMRSNEKNLRLHDFYIRCSKIDVKDISLKALTKMLINFIYFNFSSYLNNYLIIKQNDVLILKRLKTIDRVINS
jgi:hypothetical protein